MKEDTLQLIPEKYNELKMTTINNYMPENWKYRSN